MPLDDPLYCREPDTRTGKIFLAVQALKWLEQLLDELHVEPTPVVSQEIDRDSVLIVVAEFNLWFGHARSELPRVLEQILQRRLHKSAVRQGFGSVADLDHDVSVRIALRE